MSEFTEARDKAISKTVTGNDWQSFYEFTVDNDLVIPGPCPREKFGMVMLCQYHLLSRKGDTESAGAVKQLLRERGFTINTDGRGLTNLNEDDRQVLIPDCLLMFEGQPLLPFEKEPEVEQTKTLLPNRKQASVKQPPK